MAAGHYSEATGAHTLLLTPPEADTLADVLAAVGGPQTGRRRHVTSILAALRQSGVFHGVADDIEGDLEVLD